MSTIESFLPPPPEWHSNDALKIFEEGAHKRHSPIKESVSFLWLKQLFLVEDIMLVVNQS